MKKDDILSKFQSNNNKLEDVLYKKGFDSDIKNLLLSMFYNISSSYSDYARIKVNVESKNEFIDDIIDVIEKCNKIELIKASSEEGMKFINEGITSKIDYNSRSIKALPTEKAMLYALFKLNDTKMQLSEKDGILKNSLPEMLNEGRDINNIEIIRDFNSWSWNTVPR